MDFESIKKVKLSDEERKQFIREGFVPNPEPKQEDFWGAQIIKSSDDSEYEKRIKKNTPLMRGNGITMIQIGPDQIFHSGIDYYRSLEKLPIYYVQVYLANVGYPSNDLFTTQIEVAIDYYEKLEKFFEMNPIPTKVN